MQVKTQHWAHQLNISSLRAPRMTSLRFASTLAISIIQMIGHIMLVDTRMGAFMAVHIGDFGDASRCDVSLQSLDMPSMGVGRSLWELWLVQCLVWHDFVHLHHVISWAPCQSNCMCFLMSMTACHHHTQPQLVRRVEVIRETNPMFSAVDN